MNDIVDEAKTIEGLLEKLSDVVTKIDEIDLSEAKTRAFRDHLDSNYAVVRLGEVNYNYSYVYEKVYNASFNKDFEYWVKYHWNLRDNCADYRELVDERDSTLDELQSALSDIVLTVDSIREIHNL